MTKYRVVIKFIRAVPRKYRQMAMVIESFVDLQTFTSKKLYGRLKWVEESYDLDDTNASSATWMTQLVA